VINSMQGVMNALLQTAFQMGGDSQTLGRTVTYQTFTTPLYNTLTGDVTTPAPSTATVTAVLVGYTAREVLPDVVLATDQKALILKSALDALALTPQTRDVVVIDTVPWRVVSIQLDPASVTFILQIRRESSEGAV
jgi:hypothetical protein